MTTFFKTFLSDESGAVTVDWVVLTAALVGLGLAAMGVVRSGVANLSDEIGSQLANTDPSDNTFTAAERTAGTALETE
ncbi:hypothetical protein [Jannaschia sp. LMIT008]|uniref:hypothetical protein n=1 Tax=Jannaschia maritima TaxID=3032585 RepID=UPI002810F3E4|nr:hypothetical protein [Jannaschia sp. LMIT008]